MSRKNIITIILALAAMTAGAQQQREITITGDVKDGFLNIALPEACVSVLTTDSTVVVDTASMVTFYGAHNRITMARYVAKVDRSRREYLVRARLKGYDDVWRRVSIGKQTDVEVPTLEMRRMREIELGEVTVVATKVKFFYRGDTLVYDATAFKMPQGSMLGDLIRQMPGVTMNDAGEIFVNGRKVDELLLGSRSFMRGNKKVLMENLPYYTVRTLKVYEKQTDMSEALGYDVEPRRYVMDVNLKEEYQRGYIANVEGAVGTEDRWLGRGFLLGFTDRTRLTLMGNANNVNEGRHIGESGHWTPTTMPRSLLTTRSVATEVEYVPRDKAYRETLTASFTSTTDEQEMRQRREQFLAGSTPLSLSTSYSRQGNRRLSLHNVLTLKKPTWIHSDAGFDYVRRDGSMRSAFEQWDDSLTASLRTAGMSEGTKRLGYVEVQGAFNVGKGHKQRMTFYARVEHSKEEAEKASRYDKDGDILHSSDDISSRQTWGVGTLTYFRELGRDVNLSFGDKFYLASEHQHDWLYHPDTLLLPSQLDALAAITDPRNSFDLHRRRWEHSPGVSLYKSGTYEHPDIHMKVGYERWKIGVGFPVIHERLGYQRGPIDTLARQTTFVLNPSASFRHVWKDGRRDLRLNVSYKNAPANLLDRIGWQDDSHPLVVKLGNPDLKGTAKTTLNAEYFDRTGPRQGSYRLTASFDYHHRDVAQSTTYDPVTGTYTYRPMNISGTYVAHAMFDISRTIDKNRYWTWQNVTDANYHHSLDHAMLAGMAASEENVVNTLTLHDNAYIQFNKGTLNIRATGDIRWRHSEGKMYDFETLNATDFQYGLSARYTLPRLNTTLSADGNMYSRRGYGSCELNTDDFVLNASISQPFLKGKLIARIEAFDLLHQLSNTQYAVNAQGRTETWYRSLPHYVMAHLVYHWNRQSSKRKANLD